MPNADAILATVCETYANLRSYRDVGESLTEFWNDQQTRVTQRELLEIATRYRRPDHFYFDFREIGPGNFESSKYVVWMLENLARSWWSIRPDEVSDRARDHRICRAIAGATGVSSGTSCWIARLIGLEDCGPPELSRAVDGTILGEESIEETPCWRIEYADHRHPSYRYQIWIEKDSNLIRRMFEPVGNQMPPRTASQRVRMKEELEGRMHELGPDDPMRAAFARMIANVDEDEPMIRTSQTIWWRPEANPVLTDADFEFDPSQEP